jgi:hypothetical protein
MMALGTSEAMSTYCDLAQYILEYHHKLGLIYHPETMLAFHMLAQGLANHNDNSYQVVLRQLGSVERDAYRSNYGRWA